MCPLACDLGLQLAACPFGMYAGLAVCYWAVTLAILFALGPILLFICLFCCFAWRPGA